LKLSIITINRNNAAGLEKTIQSVVMQTFEDFEYILIDGASTDTSIEVIKKYSNNFTYWVSEPDTGICNAVNKGLKIARGDYCLLLNSGDWLIGPSTLKEVFKEISELGKAGVYYSDCLRSDNTLDKTTRELTATSFIFGCSINTQNAIIDRSLIYKIGFFNEALKIVSDKEFWLKAIWIHKERFIHIKTNIAIYDITGISSQVNYENEIIIMLRNVFEDLADSIIELRKLHESIYYDTITRFGESRTLNFILKSYRYIIKRLYRFPFFKKPLQGSGNNNVNREVNP
jgi:glycosyltransferase involved in cell wall biosynthesis